MSSNSKLTRNGIAYDFRISPYTLKVEYMDGDVIEYIFSSLLYKEKFEEKLESNRDKINESTSNRFGFSIKNDKLCDLKLYTTIEKRGFLIKLNEVGIEWLSNIQLNGNKLTIKS